MKKQPERNVPRCADYVRFWDGLFSRRDAPFCLGKPIGSVTCVCPRRRFATGSVGSCRSKCQPDVDGIGWTFGVELGFVRTMTAPQKWSEAEEGVEYLKRFAVLADNLKQMGSAVYENHWDRLCFGSWTITAGKRKDCFEFSWDGRGYLLTVSHCADLSGGHPQVFGVPLQIDMQIRWTLNQPVRGMKYFMRWAWDFG